MSQNNQSQNSNSADSNGRNDIEATQSRLTDSQMGFIRSIEEVYAHRQTPQASTQVSSSQADSSFWANSQTSQSIYRFGGTQTESIWSGFSSQTTLQGNDGGSQNHTDTYSQASQYNTDYSQASQYNTDYSQASQYHNDLSQRSYRSSDNDENNQE